MPIIAIDMSKEDYYAAPPWQRDRTNSGKLMLVAKSATPQDANRLWEMTRELRDAAQELIETACVTFNECVRLRAALAKLEEVPPVALTPAQERSDYAGSRRNGVEVPPEKAVGLPELVGRHVSLLLLAESLLADYDGVRDCHGNDRACEIRAWLKIFNATPLKATTEAPK